MTILLQLTIIDDAGRKQRIPYGKDGEQGQVSILVNGVALAISAFMVYLLLKRPKRQVLDF